MGKVRILMSLALFLLASAASFGQNQVEMADTMRSNGKIYVVVGIILIVLIGLIVYLFSLDRKVKKLEMLLSHKASPTK